METKIVDCNFEEFAAITKGYEYHPFLKPKLISEDLETIGKYFNPENREDFYILSRRPSNLQHLFLTGTKDENTVYQRLRY